MAAQPLAFGSCWHGRAAFGSMWDGVHAASSCDGPSGAGTSSSDRGAWPNASDARVRYTSGTAKRGRLSVGVRCRALPNERGGSRGGPRALSELKA
eukprot:7220721-Prymnesium_polylepis.1